MNHKKIKIAHIVDSARLWGVENYVLNLARVLNTKQVETWVLCRHPHVQEIYEQNGIRVKTFKLAGYLDLAGMILLSRFCKEQRIDVIHTHLGLDSLIGAVVAKLCNITCVMSVHFIEPSWRSVGSLKRELWLNVQKWKNGYIRHFLPITDQVGNRLVAREGVNVNKMTVVCPGIPAATVSPETRASLRASLGVQPEDCVVLSLSRLEPEKNIGALINSAAVLAAENKDVHFWVAGDGSQRETLERQIEHFGLADRFKLLGYRRDARELLGAADIFVLPCPVEAFGMAAVEAMFASLPVVGFGNGGLSVIVAENQTGLLADDQSKDGLTNCIRLLSTDADRRRGYGMAGYKRALTNFTDEIMAAKVLEVYRRVVTQSSAR